MRRFGAVIIGSVLLLVARSAGAIATSSDATEASAAALAEPFVQSLERSRSLELVELEQASAAIRAAAAADPTNRRWQLGVAMVERRLGNGEESLRLVRQLVEAEPNNAQYQFELGQSIMAAMPRDAGMLKMIDISGDARDAWEEAVKLDPSHVYARYALAQYYMQARKQGGRLFGSYAKAKEHGEAMLKLAGPDGPFWGNVILGQLAAAQERWDDMAVHFKAAEAAPPEPEFVQMVVVSHASALLRDKKDPAGAMPIIERLIAMSDASQITGRFFKAEAHRELKQWGPAIESYRDVLAINPDAQNSRFFLAECLEQTGDKAGAAAEYEEFARRFPDADRAKKATAAAKRLRK